MSKPRYKSWIEVSRQALVANARVHKSSIGDEVKLMAAIKANAYGHGLTETAAALRKSPVNWYGVNELDEALELRQAGEKKPILVIGYILKSRIKEAVRAGISFIAYDVDTVAAASKAATAKQPAKIHLKLETGTSRQGILEKDIPKITKALKLSRNVIVEGTSTHYANIEDTLDPSYGMKQLERFKVMVEKLERHGIVPGILHTANSAAAIAYPQTHLSLARAGIALYGLWPSPETKKTASKRKRSVVLTPALTWKTIVTQVKRLPKGTHVSYGITETLKRDSAVAVLPIGYWNGYDRKLSSVGHVLVKGKRAKVLGRVCMNMIMVDVTSIGGVRPEDEVVLLGKQGNEEVSAEEIAGKTGTINYEVVTRINPLTPRILVK